MEDKYFNIDEAMLEYSEMTSFDFNSDSYHVVSKERIHSNEYLKQLYTFKYGNYDILDMFKSKFIKISSQKS
jgi:hypothetical protein